MGCPLLATIIKESYSECSMCNSPQSLAPGSAQFSSNYQIPRLGIKIDPIRLREVPCLKNCLDLERKTLCNCCWQITVRNRGCFGTSRIFIESFTPELHVPKRLIDCKRRPYFTPFVGKFGIGRA